MWEKAVEGKLHTINRVLHAFGCEKDSYGMAIAPQRVAKAPLSEAIASLPIFIACKTKAIFKKGNRTPFLWQVEQFSRVAAFQAHATIIISRRPTPRRIGP
jgi:hypothetical protein